MRITVRVKKLDSEVFSGLSDEVMAKVVTMGNVIEVTALERGVSAGGPCRKLDKDRYLDIRDGEIKSYNHYDSRADGLDSIKKTMARIRAILNSNVMEPVKVRWITLTYRENMMDSKRLYSDFKCFWQKFIRWCNGSGFSKPEYITVQEPQGRGAWHVHAFFIWSDMAPYLPNQVIADLWGHGFVKVKALSNCDNIGAYFSAYLADIPVSDIQGLSEVEKGKIMESGGHLVEKIVDGDSKKFVKGARLSMYPPGMNILRYSKGLKMPLIEHMTLFDAKEKVSGTTETFSSTYEISECIGFSDKVLNVVHKSYYNRIRVSSKE